MRDENLVKKGLIIFVGPPKTGKNVIITRNGKEIVASLMRGGDHR